MADRPLARLRWAEDSRFLGFKQALIIAGWILLICLVAPPSLRAETPGPVAIVPANGNARGLQLRAQAVDTVIRQGANGAWADTSLWAQIHNPGAKDLAVSVALLNPQAGPGDLPEGLTLALGKTALELQPIPAQDGRPRLGPAVPITVPLRGSVILRVRYRQPLLAANDVITYTYPLTATTRWPGTPESLRVTIKFAPPVAAEQTLAYTSAPTRRDPDSMTWHWEYKRAAQDVGVVFITSAWWTALTADRAAVAAADAGLAQHLALARRYRHLADLPPSSLGNAANTFERYYPQAVAELRAGIATDAADDPALAAARVELAALYRQRAERSEPAAGQAFLQMAAAELQTATTTTNSDPAVAAAAAELYGQLAAAASARGDALLAEQHRARQAALQATGAPISADALAQTTALTQAARAAESGDLAATRALVRQAFGPAAVTLPDAPPPLIGHARVTVTSQPAERSILLQLGPAGDAATLAVLLETAAAALRPLAQVSVGADTLNIRLAGAPAEWLASQARLAEALPPAPELALLADVLRSDMLTWNTTAETFRFTEHYVELANLTSAAQVWDAQARQIEDLARTRAGATEGLPSWLDAGQRERLAGVQRVLWAEDAAAWRDLAAGSGAEYRAALGLRGGERHWAVAAGATRQLEAQAAAWREDRLLWAAGAAALLVALMALALWRLA